MSVERSAREELSIRLLSTAGWAVLHILTWSYRKQVLGRSWAERRSAGEPGRCLYAGWHCQILHLLPVLRGHGTCVMVSRHSDGEIVARIMERDGYATVRGASDHGGTAALRDLVRVARTTDRDLAIVIDGPLGPAGKVKDGILFAASRTGLPVVPVCAWAEQAWRVSSWDRTLIGRPFTRVAVAFGEPLVVPPKATREELAGRHTDRLAEAMAATEARARAAVVRSAAQPAV